MGLENECHSLEQVSFIKQLAKRATLQPREALYLATQCVNQGLSDANHLIERLQSVLPSKSVQDYLARLKKRNSAIQALALLKQFRDDPQIVRELYKTEGITFRAGSSRYATAIVIFTTKFNNFTISNLVIDAIFAELGVSRLFLRDTSEYVYLRGVKGLADSLSELPKALSRVLQQYEIKSPIFTGYSSGGYPSLYVSTKMNHIGYTGFSISSDISPHTSLPKRSMYEKVKDRVDHALLKDLKPEIVVSKAQNYSIYYGQRDPIDRAHAEHLQDIPGLRLIRHMGAGHEVTASLLEDGRFAESFVHHLKMEGNDD